MGMNYMMATLRVKEQPIDRVGMVFMDTRCVFEYIEQFAGSAELPAEVDFEWATPMRTSVIRDPESWWDPAEVETSLQWLKEQASADTPRNRAFLHARTERYDPAYRERVRSEPVAEWLRVDLDRLIECVRQAQKDGHLVGIGVVS